MGQRDANATVPSGDRKMSTSRRAPHFSEFLIAIVQAGRFSGMSGQRQNVYPCRFLLLCSAEVRFFCLLSIRDRSTMTAFCLKSQR